MAPRFDFDFDFDFPEPLLLVVVGLDVLVEGRLEVIFCRSSFKTYDWSVSV
jgi:hypothetical protein